MFGWDDEFDYFSCAHCGCLQIVRVPDDLARFYPPNYYSFHSHPVPQHGLKSWLAARRDFSAATGQGLLGRVLNRVVKPRTEVESLAGVPARSDMRILDVGCGNGHLLSILHRANFRHLEGIDPYLPLDVEVVPGLWVRKMELTQLSGSFELIMLHHTLEHVPLWRELLKACQERLSPHGKILLRFPSAESAAWEKYQENWVQLDAPRHLHLHTRKSLEIMASQVGLKIERCWCDSAGFQFWASELYKKGVSLTDETGNVRDPGKYFTKAQMQNFDKLALQMNASGQGDQLAVVLSATDHEIVEP